MVVYNSKNVFYITTMALTNCEANENYKAFLNTVLTHYRIQIFNTRQ